MISITLAEFLHDEVGCPKQSSDFDDVDCDEKGDGNEAVCRGSVECFQVNLDMDDDEFGNFYPELFKKFRSQQ